MIATIAAPCVVTPPAGAEIYVIINIVYVLLSLGPYAWCNCSIEILHALLFAVFSVIFCI